MRLYFIAVILLIFNCCSDQWSHDNVSYVDNKTAHVIKLRFYKNGDEITEVYQQVEANEKKLVHHDAGEGRARYNYLSEISSYAFDSLVVSLDDRTLIHYGFNINGSNANALKYDNNRNLFNPNSWEIRVIRDTKRRYEAEYIYTFTDKDYLNAG